ncbi:MAG: hypothetical protein IPM69_00645 [Ignavibacteria bacterium]|nr:hypothetical protein [Ignavibacteria bacterium]
MNTIFSLFLILSVISLSVNSLRAQPVPKYDLGINAGVILHGKTGASRAIGGNAGIMFMIDNYSQLYYTKPVISLFVPEDSTKSENDISMQGIISISSMIDENWQITGSVGQYFGKSTSTFSTSVNFREISTNKDTVYSSERSIGILESKLGGWILELGARYHFGSDMHPYVGAGLRYNTQDISETNLTLNGTTKTVLNLESIEELGGYIGAGFKIPLSKIFCIDIQADAIFRNAKEGELDKEGNNLTAWAIEPAFRAGVSFDLNSIFDVGKHPSDYEEEEDPNSKKKAKTKPKTPMAPGPSDK